MISLKTLIRPIAFYGGYPFFKIASRRVSAQQRIFILMYHRVDYQAYPFFEVVVKPEIFEKQIRFLNRFYKIVDLGDLKNVASHQPFGKDIVVITFDDGYRDNYIHAFPILKKYHIPATIFLTTGYINTHRLLWYDQLAWILYKTESTPDRAALVKSGLAPEIVTEVERFFNAGSSAHISILRSLVAKLKVLSAKNKKETLDRLAKALNIRKTADNGERAMLSWEEIREMSTHGISFGCHTVSHPVLSAIPLQEARKEIIESKKMIEKQLSKPVKTFAYPFGKEIDYSKEVVKLIADEGFEYSCTATPGFERFPIDDPFVLKRKGVALSRYLFI